MVPEIQRPSDLPLLPNDWDRSKFSKVCKVRQGLQVLISDRLRVPTPTSHEYITIQSINKSAQEREYIESPNPKVVCKPDDVLMTRTGNTGIVVTDVEGAFHNNFFLIDYDRGNVEKKFLVEYLRSKRVQHVLLTKAGSSTIPDLNHGDFYSIEFPLPPLPEQRKIADILSTWDRAIETSEALLATARTQKRALMQSLLTGKRRFPEFEGQEWKEVRLGDVCEPKQWMTISNKQMKEEGFPVYGANGRIGWFDEFTHLEPTIAVGCRGVCGSVHLTPPKSYITGNSMALDSLDSSKAVVGFLFQYLIYFGFRHIVSGSAQPQITGQAIKSLKIKLPSIEEQEKIAVIFAEAESAVGTHEVQAKKLRTEKKALMQQLLTGKRRVVV